jgi:hypothetical protein
MKIGSQALSFSKKVQFPFKKTPGKSAIVYANTTKKVVASGHIT